MKKHLKWLIPIVIIVAIVLLSAISHSAVLDDVCAVNDYYIIMRDGEGYILLLTEHGRTIDHFYPSKWTFNSVAEMKNRVLTGAFTEEEASAFQRIYPASNICKVCIDFDNLYEAVLPQGAQQTDVVWEGTTYYKIYFDHGNSNSEGYIEATDSGYFRHYREFVNKSHYENEANPNLTYLKSEQISDRNATAHYFSREKTAGIKDYTVDYVDLWYELSSGNKTLYVQECFELLEYQRNGTPYHIRILGKQGDFYYQLHFEDLESRPTEDWLLSFGLKPYVEQE